MLYIEGNIDTEGGIIYKDSSNFTIENCTIIYFKSAKESAKESDKEIKKVDDLKKYLNQIQNQLPTTPASS